MDFGYRGSKAGFWLSFALLLLVLLGDSICSVVWRSSGFSGIPGAARHGE